MTKPARTNNLIALSDIHVGCQFAICPPGATLANGARVGLNPVQRYLLRHWQRFWSWWVPTVTHGEPFDVVINGDAMDLRHHGTITQWTQDIDDMQRAALRLLEPVRAKAHRLWIVGGTEAHAGPAFEAERQLAQRLGADTYAGQTVPPELWIEVGSWLVHFAHHIGCTTRQAYESSGPMGELIEQWADSARWRRRPPDVVVRSHRHRHIQVSVAAAENEAMALVTPGWQAKTPFVSRGAGRNQSPQFGGILLRQGKAEPHERHYVVSLPRTPAA